MPSPLSGIRILDFTRYQNGPHASVMLADMGAEVIKVELPGDGDPGRSLGRLPNGYCSYFEANNRGKRSITLDLRTPEAREIVCRVVTQMDVVMENFRPGVMDRMGLGYDVLRAHNPRLIYGATSGFGLRGPRRDQPAFDHIAQGMSGAMIAQGGGPGRDPMRVIFGAADQVGSMLFAYGVTMALVARERFGVGQRVDGSILAGMLTLQNITLQDYLYTREQAGGRWNQAATGYHPAGDGKWLTTGALDPKDWPRLCRALGREDLIDDPRSAEPFARWEHADWLIDEFRRTLALQPRDYWLAHIAAEGVACGPVYEYAEVLADEQFWANGYFAEVPHPIVGQHTVVGIPLTLSETPGSVERSAPELGQDTEQVLLEAGYSWEEIERFHDAGVTALRA